MKFSEAWLREWVNPPVSTAELVEKFTMCGLEVDSVTPVGGDFNDVVVARIEERAPHPDADRLSVCTVSIGKGRPAQVVCGAPNARTGLVAPLARVGARLGDHKVGKAKLRGVESRGMLCSERELGLSDDAAGLMELPDDAPLGTSLAAYLALDDHSIDIDLTPNRGDCLSVLGVAREVAAYYGLDPAGPDLSPVAPVNDATFPVALDDAADCARFAGRVIRNIDPAVRTPVWLSERLRRAGIRPVSPVVDVTQYVMLELGQPMHAYDLSKLQGGIVTRRGRKEKLTLLDGREVEADDEVLVIADDSGAIGLAGVMGGESTAVDGDTRDIFLESAWFAPSVILGRARRFGLHTDASHRFERCVDPAHQARAVERATALLLDIVGGEPGPTQVVESVEHLPAPEPVMLRSARLAQLLGAEVPAEETQRILEALDMVVEDGPGGWIVTAPTARSDIAIEADLVEEVGRIYGYERLPSRSLSGPVPMPPLSDAVVEPNALRQVLVNRGYQEAVTYSFVAGEQLSALGPAAARGAIPLANPLSADMDVMRTLLLPGLLQVLVHNLNRQHPRVRLFELGKVFSLLQGEVTEETHLAGVAAGPVLPEQWGAGAREVDFYDVKGDVESLAAVTGDARRLELEPGGPAWLHPGQAGTLSHEGRPVGWVGRVHPALVRDLDLPGVVLAFELDVAPLLVRRIPVYAETSRFPAIRRDIAVIVPERVTSEAVTRAIEAELPAELESEVVLFDVFRGKNIGNSRKSLTLGLILRSASRTLTDEEADSLKAQVVAKLQQTFEATLRE